MKILVISDTHGNPGAVESLLQELGGEMNAVIHLGDGYRDLLSLNQRYPVPKQYFIHGNCDGFCNEPSFSIVETPAGKAFITHGHMFGVKGGLGNVAEAARQEGAKICMFGHTHEPLCRVDGGLLLLNPGSLSFPKGRYPTYAVLTAAKEGAEAALVAITPFGKTPVLTT